MNALMLSGVSAGRLCRRTALFGTGGSREGAIMRFRTVALFVAIDCCLLMSCGVNVIVHDQHAAAKAATKFAELAYIRSDYAAAEALFLPQLQPVVPTDKLTAEVNKMHPKGRPSEVKAMEYEPIPGQRTMSIYLEGNDDGESFFYRLLMAGDRGSGYRVAGLWRGSGPYPRSARKPL
jgi:hypothetical protein